MKFLIRKNGQHSFEIVEAKSPQDAVDLVGGLDAILDIFTVDGIEPVDKSLLHQPVKSINAGEVYQFKGGLPMFVVHVGKGRFSLGGFVEPFNCWGTESCVSADEIIRMLNSRKSKKIGHAKVEITAL